MPRPDRRTSRAPHRATPRRPGERAPLRPGPRARSSGVGPVEPADTTTPGARSVLSTTSATDRGWRPRLTGRAAVLVLVVAVLTVSYASSLKAYLTQRQHIAELKAEIAQSQSDINALEREKARWRDPAYVQSQARARFGYVMPGETSYVVLDADGKPLEAQTSLRTTQEVLAKEPTAWFETAWSSVLLAGNPPVEEEGPTPLDKIGPEKKQ